jgi:nodulation protein E
MGARRVVVSGLGVISALGRNREEFWQALRDGRSGIARIEAVDPEELQFKNGAEVRGFRPGEAFDEKPAENLDRFVHFLLVAARQAVKDAGLGAEPRLGERAAVVTGCCLGGKTTEDRRYLELYGEKRTRFPPLTIPQIMANAGASHLSMELGVTGPGFTLSTACSSSSHAIGLAFWMVRQGIADLAITGGSETPFSLGILKAWEALRAVAPDTCRPFSKDRRGLILGEGGAILILEPLEAARSRGAPIYAEVLGFGMSSDASHITQPSAEGAARAMQAALADAGLAPERIGYVNAHGTGTLANDPTETRAIRQTFGPHANRLAVSSTKSLHGHALGAAGALEAIATVLALKEGVIPPTANFSESDPECDLDVVPNRSRRMEVEAALSNSFAFGGLNAVLAFRRWGD